MFNEITPQNNIQTGYGKVMCLSIVFLQSHIINYFPNH